MDFCESFKITVEWASRFFNLPNCFIAIWVSGLVVADIERAMSISFTDKLVSLPPKSLVLRSDTGSIM